jgi:hypothetical protein
MLIQDDCIRDTQFRVPLTMNLDPYLGPINRVEGLECIGKSRTELTNVHYRRSYNPNKRDETTTLSTQHEHYYSLELPIKVKTSNPSLRAFRKHLEVVRRFGEGF